MFGAVATHCRRCLCTEYIYAGVDTKGFGHCACYHSEGEHTGPNVLAPPQRQRRDNLPLTSISIDLERTVHSICVLYSERRRTQVPQQDFPNTFHDSQPSGREQTPCAQSSSAVSTLRSQSSVSSVFSSADSHILSSQSDSSSQSPRSPRAKTLVSLPSLASTPPRKYSPFVPSTRPGPAQSWSTTDRRLTRAPVARTRDVTNTPFGPVPTFMHRQPVNTQRRVSQSRSTLATGSTPSTRGNIIVRVRKYLVIMHPEPAHGTISTDSGDIFSVMRAPVPQNIERFIPHVDNYHLMFSFECTARDIDVATPAVHSELQRHLTHHGLAFATSPTTSHSTSGSPSQTSSSIPWSFLTTLKGQRTSAFGARLLPARARADTITHGDSAKIAMRFPIPPPVTSGAC